MKKYLIILVLFSSFSCENETSEPLPDPKKYSLTLNIYPAGAGILSESSGEYEENESISILATPYDNYNFDGWTGSIISSDNPLFVEMDSDKTITANFSEIELCEVDYSTLHTGINTLTSHYQPMNIPFVDYAGALNVELPEFGSYGIWSAHGEFNNNNIPDYVMASGNWENTSNNEVTVVIDGEIVHRFQNPQVQTRKVSLEDINNDGKDEIILFGTGPDIGNSPGDKITVIYVDQNNYQIEIIDEYSGFFHNGAVGDLNSDDFPDIIGIDAQAFTKSSEPFVNIYLNDFESGWIKTETNITTHHVARTYISEFYDINNDGKLDLILGGHEWEEEWMSTSLKPVQWRTHILIGLGDGQFDFDNPLILPEVENWGVITDFDIYDLDNDGNNEIIVSRTTGREGINAGLPIENVFYDGILIQILKLDGDNWYEWKTVKQTSLPDAHIIWAYATLIYDVNKDCLLDIVPESDKINSKSFSSFDQVRGLYFEQQPDGSFLKKYKE